MCSVQRKRRQFYHFFIQYLVEVLNRPVTARRQTFAANYQAGNIISEAIHGAADE